MAAHKIEVASKVIGRVAWIGVDKGDKVKQGQVIVRLEDDEYRAQLQQARGQLANLEARLNLERTRQLVAEKVLSRQSLDDAQARYDAQLARGAVNFYQTQLANTVIRAPVAGTILERVVEKGEFVTTDAFPDRRYEGVIDEISPEANRQKATVQIKVKILEPDDYLRPEMNASVSFYSEEKPDSGGQRKPVIVIPSSALRNDAVFVSLGGKAIRRAVKTGAATTQGIRIEDGLIGGEELIVNPP